MAGRACVSATAGAAAVLAASSPKRRRAASSARARTLSSVWWRASSSALRRSASVRSRARRSFSAARRTAASAAARRSSASWTLASASARGASVDLVGGKLAEHQPGARGGGGRRGNFGDRRRHRARGATGASTTGRTATGAGASGFSPGSVMRTLLALDLDHVGPAVGKTLANGIALDGASLQAQRAFRGIDRLVPCLISHACLWRSYSPQGQVIHFNKGIERAVTVARAEVVAAAVAVEIPNPRQHICSRRAGKQRSMYHICSTECQIQLLGAKTRMTGRLPAPKRRLAAPCSLATPSAPALGPRG